MPRLSPEQFAALDPASRSAALCADLEAQLYALGDPAAPKLTYSLAGRSFSWTEYRQFLQDALEKERAVYRSLTAPVTVVVALD